MSLMDKLGDVGEAIQGAVSSTTATIRNSLSEARASVPEDDLHPDPPNPFPFPNVVDVHGHSLDAICNAIGQLSRLANEACNDFLAADTDEHREKAYGRFDRIARKSLIAENKPLLSRIVKTATSFAGKASPLVLQAIFLELDNSQLEASLTVLARSLSVPSLLSSSEFSSCLTTVSSRLANYHTQLRKLCAAAIIPRDSPSGTVWGEADIGAVLLAMKRAYETVSDVPGAPTTVAGRIGSAMSSLWAKGAEGASVAAAGIASAADAASEAAMGGKPGSEHPSRSYTGSAAADGAAAAPTGARGHRGFSSSAERTELSDSDDALDLGEGPRRAVRGDKASGGRSGVQDKELGSLLRRQGGNKQLPASASNHRSPAQVHADSAAAALSPTGPLAGGSSSGLSTSAGVSGRGVAARRGGHLGRGDGVGGPAGAALGGAGRKQGQQQQQQQQQRGGEKGVLDLGNLFAESGDDDDDGGRDIVDMRAGAAAASRPIPKHQQQQQQQQGKGNKGAFDVDL